MGFFGAILGRLVNITPIHVQRKANGVARFVVHSFFLRTLGKPAIYVTLGHTCGVYQDLYLLDAGQTFYPAPVPLPIHLSSASIPGAATELTTSWARGEKRNGAAGVQAYSDSRTRPYEPIE